MTSSSSSASSFDPSEPLTYNGPLSNLSDAQLIAYYNAASPNSDAHRTALRELKQREHVDGIASLSTDALDLVIATARPSSERLQAALQEHMRRRTAANGDSTSPPAPSDAPSPSETSSEEETRSNERSNETLSDDSPSKESSSEESLSEADELRMMVGKLEAENQHLEEQVSHWQFQARRADPAPNRKPPVDPEAEQHPLQSNDPLEGCEPLPDAAFEALPPLLAEPCGFWSRPHRRDVFLTAALGIVSGCLPNVEGYWGMDVPSVHGPNLYTAFVAGAAGGKSAGSFARSLGSDVHRQIRERSQHEASDWEAERDAAEAAGETLAEPRPPEKRLWTPANTSYSHLLHTLNAQDGRGVIFSSEIDTVADALGQDWGAFDSLLRKAYHHEADDQGRRESGTLQIDDPRISLVLGGTERQFTKLIGSAENGLFSRMSLYYFETAAPYEIQRPTRAGIERLERLEALGERVGMLWRILDGRETPIRFELQDAHWPRFADTFAPLHRDVQAFGFSHLLSIPRRAGLWAYRIAMILAVLRAFADDAPLAQIDTLEAHDTDLDAGLAIAHTYADHALRFARVHLNDSQPKSAKDRRIAAMLASVGDTFTSTDAYEAAWAQNFDVSRQTLIKDLQTAESRGLIQKGSKRSHWEKL